MSNYTKTTDFAAKDSLPTGDSGKIIRGAEFETEFDAIATAIATKANTAGPTFTGTATFATTNATTVQIGGVAITSTAAELNTLDGITSTTAELNTLDGFTGTVDDLNYAKDLRASGVTGDEFDILDGLTATAVELNILDGATVTTAELNLLDGVTATTVELNILDGVTSTATEINLLDGVTATTAELNLLDGVTATTDELNYVDGVTSAIQTQLDAKAPTASPTLTGTVTAADLIITNRQVATDDASGVNIDGNDVTIRGGASTGTGAGGSVIFQTTPADVAGNLVNTFSTVMTLNESGIDVAGAVEFDSLSGTGSVSITDILDEDDMTSDSATALATQQSIKAYVDTTVAATNEVVEDTTPQLGGDLDTNGSDILFADNDKAIFGAGSDLQIYHDGSHSYVSDQGTGNLRVLAENFQVRNPANNEAMIIAIPDSGVTLYHDNTARFATTSTGIDVTGTVTADGLTVDGDGSFTGGLTISTSSNTMFDLIDTSSSFRPTIRFMKNEGSGAEQLHMLRDDGGNLDLKRGTSGLNQAQFASNGDISFYEDTGTTAKLFWDASAESLGIGTTSPASTSSLHLKGAGGTELHMESGDGASTSVIKHNQSNDSLEFYPDGSLALTLQSDNEAYFTSNVGIGISNPSTALHVVDTTGDVLTLEVDSAAASPNIVFKNNDGENARINSVDGGELYFGTGSSGTEALRIDSSQNVGIGTSSPANPLHVATSSTDVAKFATTGAYNFVTLDNATRNWALSVGSRFDIYDRTAASTRMSIDSSGNLLVGKTASSFNTAGIQLQSNGELYATRAGGTVVSINRKTDDGAIVNFAKDGTTVGNISSVGGSDIKVVFSGDGDQYITGNATSNYLTFSSANAERMRLDSSGNLLVGTTTASLATASGSVLYGAGSVKFSAGGLAIEANRHSSDGEVIRLTRNGTDVGSIDVTTSATTYNTSSDQRLKDNIVDAPSASDDIDAIQVRSFDWKADGSHQKYGMVAQELQSIAPEAVSQGETEEDMMGVDYSKLVPMMLKEIQSLRARVAQLEGDN